MTDLAIIESPLNGQVVNVGIEDGSHLSFLYGTDPTLRVKDEDRNILLPPQAINGSRSSVATCCANYCEMVSVFTGLALIPPDEEVFKEVS